MPSKRWETVQDALWTALRRTPAAREAFVAESYAADPELLGEVRSLLQAHEQAGHFLEGPFSLATGTSTPGRGPTRVVFEEIVALTAAERAAYLERACVGQPRQFRRELEALLDAYEGGLGILHGSDPPVPPDPLVDRVISHYRITEKLGEGGMGVVYKARDTRLDRLVALKFLPPHLDGDEGAKERLVREAKAASALDHVNICTIHEIGETDAGQVFIAMAYYAGETLEKKLVRRTLSLDEALRYAVGIAQGLAKAHELGLVHRDIKPANVTVTEDGVVKLLDFGLARRADVSGASADPVRGTVAYMSPEQARGEVVDHRTDVWSLGVVLYEMLAGRRPFRGDDAPTIIRAILHDEPDPVAGLPEEPSHGLGQVLKRTLAKKAAERYGVIEDLVRDLERALRTSMKSGPGGDPTSAHAGSASRPGRGRLLPEGERVQATVVVSRLSAPADLAEPLTTEQFDGALRLVRHHAVEVARRYGGVVEGPTGEEIVAIFGVPTPREQDSVQAGRASLELHAWLRAQVEAGFIPNVQLRTGMDTGLVAAREARQGEQRYRIVGSPQRVAARLALHAGSDEVLVSPESRRLLAPFFQTEDGAPLRREGPEPPKLPARIVEASASRSPLEAIGPAWLTTYAGRETELEMLHVCFQRAVAGEGQVVTVMGEAGLGKSRLLHELRRQLPPDCTAILQGRCSSHRTLIPFQPFVDALRADFLIGPDIAESEGGDRVAAGILAAAPELSAYVPLYLHLLSMPSKGHPLPDHLQGEELHLALLDALLAVFTRRARQGPLMLFLEDWHWSDEASRKVLDRLVDLLPAHAAMAVVTFRPEYAPTWDHPPQQTTIRLRPLEKSASSAIIRSALHAAHIPEAVGALLHERTGGNPFFLEEMCHAMREEGILRVEEGRVIPVRAMHTLRLPNTVQAVIRTRLSRLDLEARRVLRLASVAGRSFTRELLRDAKGEEGDSASSLDASLEVLRSAGVIHQTDVLPEATYRFRHALTREAAYDSLLPHQRKRMHALVGEAIEVRFAERLDEHAEVLAHHFVEATDWRKAVRYVRLAAERTYRLGQVPEAIALYERARNALERLPDDAERRRTLIEILLRQERLYEQIAGHEAQQAVIDGLFALLDSRGDSEALAETHIRQGDLHILQGRFAQAEEALNKALSVSRARAHVPGEQKALRSMGFLRWHQDRHQEAESINEELVAIDRQRGDVEALVTDLLNLLTVLRRMKAFDRGRICVEELLVLSEQIEDPIRKLPLYNSLGEFYRGLGDHSRALSFLDRAMEIAEQNHYLGSHPYLMAIRAQIFLEQGRVDESIQCYQEAIAMHRSSWPPVGVHGSAHVNSRPGLAGLLRSLGEMLVAMQRGEEALPYLEEATSLSAHSQDPETEALLRSKIAVLHEGGERAAAAQLSWEQVRALCRGLGDIAGECRALQGLGRTARRQGKIDDALLCYRAALRLAEQAGDEAAQGDLHNTMGILVWRRGDYAEALAHYEQALRIYEVREEPIHAGLMLNSIGATLHEIGRPADAVRSLKRAIHLHRRTEQRQFEAYALGVLGDIHFSQDRHAEALPCYEASLALRPDLGDRRGEGWMLHRLARIYAAQGLGGRSRSTALQATAIAAELGDLELSRMCRPLTALPGA